MKCCSCNNEYIWHFSLLANSLPHCYAAAVAAVVLTVVIIRVPSMCWRRDNGQRAPVPVICRLLPRTRTAAVQTVRGKKMIIGCCCCFLNRYLIPIFISRFSAHSIIIRIGCLHSFMAYCAVAVCDCVYAWRRCGALIRMQHAYFTYNDWIDINGNVAQIKDEHSESNFWLFIS